MVNEPWNPPGRSNATLSLRLISAMSTAPCSAPILLLRSLSASRGSWNCKDSPRSCGTPGTRRCRKNEPISGRYSLRRRAPGLEFLIVGGAAATAHGAARLTLDLDIVYRRSAAAQHLDPYLRGAPPGLPFRCDERTISRGLNFTLSSNAGDFDLLGEITGVGNYDALLPDTIMLELFGISCRCLSLSRLIQVKTRRDGPKTSTPLRSWRRSTKSKRADHSHMRTLLAETRSARFSTRRSVLGRLNLKRHRQLARRRQD